MSFENAFRSELGKEVIKLKEENKELNEAVIRKEKELLRIRGSLVTELCPNCGEENTVKWNVAEKGYRVFCPNCGVPLLLCSECMMDDRFCNWDEKEELCYRDIEGLWKSLEDVTFVEDDKGRMVTECGYCMMVSGRTIKDFPPGTDREEIWQWVDKRHPKGVAYLLGGK